VTHERFDDGRQALFGIVQGGVYADLREAFTRRMVDMDFPGYAIGGLAVGESREDMFKMVEVTAAALPREKPRYLMGVGFPDDIVEAVSRGMDMFDCVLPTRNARNGTVFTRRGRLVLKNAHQSRVFGPIDEECGCPACIHYTRAYIRHLFQAGEILASRLATIHSVYFYLDTMRMMRRAIMEDRFPAWREEFLRIYRNEDSIDEQ
jgi:queuine tRNA-ribosyltransferase